ncbi:unnamed protein product [Brachionus calyciflorus]|uniref:Uncharacterized protein n=1 Tax=Brachionus calyciflorus TaxID=104777 RepID=A0A814BSZ9_9BILA|nr:unnamed protein product [Brachionus calyciflorus]
MCGIKQPETDLTNEELYKIVNQRPFTEELRKRQLKFIGHCLRTSPNEPKNIYVFYQSKVRERNKISHHPHHHHSADYCHAQKQVD